MRFLLFILFYTISPCLSAQYGKTRVYLFPGQGSDQDLFEAITLDSSYELVHITYPIPAKNTTLPEFAKLIAQQIDTTRPYIFIGVSLGGMLCTELADSFHPQKIIVISSAKCRQELPLRYRFQHTIGLNKIVPARMVKAGARILQPIVEPDRNTQKTIFRSMLKKKDPRYLKRTVNMIINWDRTSYSPTIIHIHGDADHTLPLKHIKADYIVQGGSHMMTLTKGKIINALLLKILKSNET